MRYAPLFAGLMTLWPVLALLGTQGYTPLLGLCALAALPFLRLQAPRAAWIWTGFAFVLWVCVTSAWSPASEGPILSGSLSEGNFAVKASWIRLVLVALATLAVIAAVQRIPVSSAPRAATWLIWIFLIHGAMLAAMPALVDYIFAAAYETPEDALRKGVQNLLRFAGAFTLAAPILIGLFWPMSVLHKGAVIVCSIFIGLVLAMIGASAALIALALAALAMALVSHLPRSGFRVLFGALAGLVLLAPFLLGGAARLFGSLGIALPASFQSRAWSWHVVTGKIAERPFTGHGLEAASTWRDTYTTRPDWLAEIVARGGDERAWSNYPIVPTHPHNMALEIWAETGLVGAVLAAAFLVLLGWSLPRPETLSTRQRLASAGLVGAALALFSFSYSMWNEAFWANLVLAVAAMLLITGQLARRSPETA